MSIIFYSMNGCGYCQKAKQMFNDEISSGLMVVKPASEAPDGVRGFPTFAYNNKMHSGLPGSKKELYTKLNYSNEGYSHEGYHNKDTFDFSGIL
jgi:glutaredoxin